VHVEGACLVFAGGAAEGVDRWPDGDAGEAGVLEDFLPARTGQPAGESSGPQVDVAQRFRRDGVPRAD
jgi:hypothetical protein